jgi:hypothetical protein
MASLAGTGPQKSLERGALNDLGTGLAFANGTSTEVGLGSQGPTPILIDAFTISVLSHLNGGTITAGTLTVDVSDDGVNWTDSGITGITVPTTDGGYAIISVTKYSATAKMPVRYCRAKVASAASTGSPTIDLALAA